MCVMYIINELVLGNRTLGYEIATDKEIIEMTSKQLKDALKNVKDIRGLIIDEKSQELIFDKEGFYTRNCMIKSHINQLKAKVPEESIANIMYVVTGMHNEGSEVLFDVISSRFARESISEDKLKALYEIGSISGGVKIENNKILLAEKNKKTALEKTNSGINVINNVGNTEEKKKEGILSGFSR